MRLARTGLRIVRDVHGFKFVAAAPEDRRPSWRVEGAVAEKVTRLREAEEQRLRGTQQGDDLMEVDRVEGSADDELSDDEDDAAQSRDAPANPFHRPSEYATLTLNSYNAILTLIAAIL